jgi:anti-anti-sigma factor
MLSKRTETQLRQVGKVAIIDLVGDVTSRDQQAIRNAYAKALASEPEHILFNFNDTEYINTTGIGVLISIVMEAERAGRKIGFYGMSAHYRKVFSLVRLPLYADMYKNESEALASL